jgi:hypothetical protein
MRAHKLQREDTHANCDEQQRKEYRELSTIDPQGFFTQRRKERKDAKKNLARLCALCVLCAFA